MMINFNNIHFSIRLGHWEFRPGLVPTVAVLLLLPCLLFLGFWQLQRAVAKQQLLDQFALRSQQAPQPLQEHEPLYTPVQITGHYDYAHIILLDNRIVNHQVGYDVLLPFIPDNSLQHAVLVNLGWISTLTSPPVGEAGAKHRVRGVQTTTLPRSYPSPAMLRTVTSPTGGEVTIIGLAHRPEHNLVLAHPQTALQWPLLVEDIQLTQLSRFLNRPLYPFILLLSGNAGFTHHWDRITAITPARHRGYAVQWFALALTLTGLYVKLNMHRRTHEK